MYSKELLDKQYSCALEYFFTNIIDMHFPA